MSQLRLWLRLVESDSSTRSPTNRDLDAAEEYERLAKTVQNIPDDLLVAY